MLDGSNLYPTGPNVKKAIMTCCDADGEVDQLCTIEVSSDAHSIRVFYRYEGPQAYSGTGSNGHYLLKMEGSTKNGCGTLHTTDGETFEGSWVEDGYEGFWKIVIREGQ